MLQVATNDINWPIILTCVWRVFRNPHVSTVTTVFACPVTLSAPAPHQKKSAQRKSILSPFENPRAGTAPSLNSEDDRSSAQVWDSTWQGSAQTRVGRDMLPERCYSGICVTGLERIMVDHGGNQTLGSVSRALLHSEQPLS